MSEDIMDDSTEEEEVKSEKIDGRSKKKSTVSAARSRASYPAFLRSRWPGKVLVNSDETPSGNRYLFEKGGELEVAAEDVEVLLARRRSVGCCGSGRAEEPFFELV